MFIPGFIISLLTFPGVVMHEISHRFMCDVFHVPVYEIGYFNLFSSTAGHVLHAPINKLKHNLCIALAPIFFNSLVCMLLTFPYSSILAKFNVHPQIATPLYLFLWWMGISCGAHAFPSNQDVDSVMSSVEDEFTFGLKFLSYFVRILNFLSSFWLSFIYALAISFILPVLVFK